MNASEKSRPRPTSTERILCIVGHGVRFVQNDQLHAFPAKATTILSNEPLHSTLVLMERLCADEGLNLVTYNANTSIIGGIQLE